MPTVIVVGAGLAGLACARALQEAHIDVEIVEKSNRSGGRIKTDVVDGFRFDHGFQVLNPAYSELRRFNLVNDLKMCFLPKGFEIDIDGSMRLIGDPRENVRYLKDDLSRVTGSLREKIAFLSFIVGRSHEGTLGDAMKSSGKFYQESVKGFLDGVFLTDSDRVSSHMAREILRWFVRGNPGVPTLGMGELAGLLAIGLNIQFNCRVDEVRDGIIKTSSGDMKADYIVIATDPNTTQRLISKSPVEMNHSWTWYHAVPKGLVTSRYLRVLPHNPFINSVAISNIAPSYAPANQTLISSTTLQKISEEEAKEAVARAWRIPTSEIQHLRSYEIVESLPLHEPGRPLDAPQAISDRVVVAGDYYAIPAQQGALRSGRLAAEMIIARL
jgi:phytoene dehydrogenase-like protein